MYYHSTKKYGFFSSWYMTHFCDPSRKNAMLFRISRHVRNLIHAIKKVHDQNKWFGKLFIVRAFFSSFFFSFNNFHFIFISFNRPRPNTNSRISCLSTGSGLRLRQYGNYMMITLLWRRIGILKEEKIQSHKGGKNTFHRSRVQYSCES